MAYGSTLPSIEAGCRKCKFMNELDVRVTWAPRAEHYKVDLIIGKHHFTSFPNKEEYSMKDGIADPIAEAARVKADLVATLQAYLSNDKPLQVQRS